MQSTAESPKSGADANPVENQALLRCAAQEVNNANIGWVIPLRGLWPGSRVKGVLVTFACLVVFLAFMGAPSASPLRPSQFTGPWFATTRNSGQPSQEDEVKYGSLYEGDIVFHSTDSLNLSLSGLENDSMIVTPTCAKSMEDCGVAECCAEEGKQCYEKNENISRCKYECAVGPDPVDADGLPWTCKKKGSRTRGPNRRFMMGPAGWTQSDCAGYQENCTEAQCCKEAGMQCYTKRSDGFNPWAMCKPSCSPGPDPTDIDAEFWDCQMLGMRTPGVVTEKPSPAAPWVKEQCSDIGDNCAESRCCTDPGMQCYKKNSSLALCKASCGPGPDPTDPDSHSWSCDKLGSRTPGAARNLVVDPQPWVKTECAKGDGDCSKSRCCADPGMQCFEKQNGLAMCMDSCTPGPQLTDTDSDWWSCNMLGSRTPGHAPRKNARVAPWVEANCSKPNEDCRDTYCCSQPGAQCFTKNPDWATCKNWCKPGYDPADNWEYWNCIPLGDVWSPMTYKKATKTWGSPSLMCYSVSRKWGYEREILTSQRDKSSGIFACDGTLVACAEDFAMDGVESIVFEDAAVGWSKDGTAGNALLFMHVWDKIAADGRYKYFDFTVKVDPDAVLLPDRLRNQVRPHVWQNVFFRNCNAWPGPDYPMMYGSLEVISKVGLQTYFNGKGRCDGTLPFSILGEDLYLNKCLLMLGVSPVDNFGIILDGVCAHGKYVPYCANGYAAAFHPMKSKGAWENCLAVATR